MTKKRTKGKQEKKRKGKVTKFKQTLTKEETGRKRHEKN